MWKWLRITVLVIAPVMLVLGRGDKSPMEWKAGLILSAICVFSATLGSLFYGATSLGLNSHKNNLLLPSFSANPFDARVVLQSNHFFRYFFFAGSVSQLLLWRLPDALVLFSVSSGFYLAYRFLCRVNSAVLVVNRTS